MCSGIESTEIPVELSLAAPVSGGIGDDQWRVDGNHTVDFHVRRYLRQNVGVVAGNPDMLQCAVVVKDCDAGGAASAPREVDPDVVHDSNRKLSDRDDS